MDATVAYKQAALNCIAYLRKLGYTREQAYLLLSAAPVQAHLAAIVDSPNACVTLGLPTEIFDEVLSEIFHFPVKRFDSICRLF